MNVTCYVAPPFVMADDGVVPSETAECPSANTARVRAEGFSRASLAAPARSRAAGPDIWRVVTSATPS
jgi:hypothetical protein